MLMDAPFVIQCDVCRRVLTDSNQLRCAVESLDVLVVDAVVGVRIGEASESAPLEPMDGGGSDGLTSSVPLSCSECEAQVGRVYSAAPPELASIVSTPAAPRYALQRGALASYVLGSARLQHDTALALPRPPVDADVSRGAAHDAAFAAAAAPTACDGHWIAPSEDGTAPGPNEAEAGLGAAIREALRALAERVASLEADRSSAADGAHGDRDEGARERISQLTRALIAIDARVEAVEAISARAGAERGVDVGGHADSAWSARRRYENGLAGELCGGCGGGGAGASAGDGGGRREGGVPSRGELRRVATEGYEPDAKQVRR